MFIMVSNYRQQPCPLPLARLDLDPLPLVGFDLELVLLEAVVLVAADTTHYLATN